MSVKRNKSSSEMERNETKEFSNASKLSSSVIGEYNERDEIYDPFEHRDKADANSDLGALAHLLKASLGSGILAMPMAIMNGGLIFGAIGTLVLGVICAHCVHILVKSSHVLCKRTKTPTMTYAETVHAALDCGPKPIRKFANFLRVFVNASLIATYVGSVCVYIVFIAKSIKQVTDHHAGMDIDVRLYMIALIPAVVLLSQIRNLKYLVPFSIIANFAIVISLGITFYFIFEEIKPISSVKMISRIEQMPFFFATVIFAIEGIGVVMPVVNSMEKPQHFLGCPSVLNITTIIVVGLYATIGVFGYLRYGEDTKTIVTLNLDTRNPLAQVVKLLIALAILFTYGLQFFVPLEIVYSAVKSKFSKRYENIGQIVVRVLMALFSIAIAVAVPTLEPFIALVGAVFFSILGIGIPAIVETISCWEAHLGTLNWRLWKNCSLVAFATFALATGAIVSVKGIIDIYVEKAE